MEADKKIAIIGAGGHGKVVASTILANGFKIEGFYDDDELKIGKTIFGCQIKPINELSQGLEMNAIIAVGKNSLRKKISNEIECNWVSVIHPFSSVDADVQIGKGTVIFAGSIVQPGAQIGDHVIINTKSSVDHDTHVGDYSHVSVSHLAGGASIDEGVFMALHSVVLPSINVGAWATIGAGAVVTKNVNPGATVVGIPARPLIID